MVLFVSNKFDLIWKQSAKHAKIQARLWQCFMPLSSGRSPLLSEDYTTGHHYHSTYNINVECEYKRTDVCVRGWRIWSEWQSWAMNYNKQKQLETAESNVYCTLFNIFMSPPNVVWPEAYWFCPVRLSVRPCVRRETLTRYLAEYLTHFHQTYTTTMRYAP